MKTFFALFPNKVEHCTTIAQRRDAGGMVQSIVMFEGKDTLFFAYWLSVQQGDRVQLIFFNLNTDIEKIMAFLR